MPRASLYRCTRLLAALALLGLSLTACKREAPAAPTRAPEPRPAEDFCKEEADGDYLNPLSCRSQVICREHRITEVRACPEGEVINGLSEQRPLRCTPLAESGLNDDCSFKPVPLSDVLPDEAPAAPAIEADAAAAAHP